MIGRDGHRVGQISLPVNDDGIRGRLVPIAATFLLATATEREGREKKE